MKDINTNVNRGRFLALLFSSILISIPHKGWSDDKVTRVYMLKNADVSNISRVLNVVVRDTTHTRVIGGEGRRVVITDTPDQQDSIAQILPVLDQPISETSPNKIQMKMLMNAAQYLRQQKIAAKPVAPAESKGAAPAATSAAAASAPAASASVASASGASASAADIKFKPVAYKSIYASDDAKLKRAPRDLTEEPAVAALSALELRGIFRASTSSPLALLSLAGTNYTAHDGGLYANNHMRLKNVSSKVFKDHVVLEGPDRIPHEIRFKTTL